MDEIVREVERFIAEWHQIQVDEYARRDFTGAPEAFGWIRAPKSPFLKICKMNDGKPGAAEAFVALDDGENKTIGAFKRGQVFYPASYYRPAKHARGTIWQPAAELARPFGLKTLRGSGA